MIKSELELNAEKRMNNGSEKTTSKPPEIYPKEKSYIVSQQSTFMIPKQPHEFGSIA